jgi:hypothetical protein
MQPKSVAVLIGIVAVGGALIAQQSPPQQKIEGARDLFYFGATQKDTLPPIQKASSPSPPKGPKSSPATQVAAAASPGVPHLGFRYTVTLVNQTTGKAEAVDPDRDFRKGECVRLEVESNQSGYLYVLSKQSSGGWLPLFPSPEMPDQSNVADPGQKVRVPKDYCFEISDPPGTETMFLALSRSPRDFFDLYDAIKAPSSVTSNPVQLASARKVNSAVEKMAANFGTRDLMIKKVTPSADKQETDYSVYVVNGSTSPSSTVVKKVELRHR